MTSVFRIGAAQCAGAWGVVLLAALVGVAPAASAKPGDETEAQDSEDSSPIFYPPAPDEPRIQFLRGYDREEVKAKKRGRFRNFIVGDEETEPVRALGRPYGVAIHDGKIFVGDIAQKVVNIIDIKTGAFSTLIQGDSDYHLSIPANIAIDADGTRYIADRGLKRVMVYSPKGKYLTAYASADEMTPTDVAIHEDALYVCDIADAQVIVLDKRTGKELRRIGQPGTGVGELSMPVDVEVDRDGNVYVCDQMNARVLKYNSRGEYVQQFGERGDSSGQFFRPKGIAVDREGRLYVVDANWENVQIFDYDGQLLLPFPGSTNLRGLLVLPATIAIDYDNVELFEDLVAPGHELEYLILVTSQYGPSKVNVYGFLKKNE